MCVVYSDNQNFNLFIVEESESQRLSHLTKLTLSEKRQENS